MKMMKKINIGEKGEKRRKEKRRSMRSLNTFMIQV